MSSDKVVPFRKRPPTPAQLEMYRRITRNWHPEARRLMFPELFQQERTQKT